MTSFFGSPSWSPGKLQDLVLLQRGFDITKAEQKDGEIPVISSSGPGSRHNIPKVQGPGVIIGRKGTLGSVFYSEGDYWPHDTTLWSKELKGNNPRFVYYALQCIEMSLFDTGAANPTLNRNHIHGLPIFIPERRIQDRIADILTAYDDLIENNRRRIALLEDAARQLYKEWFVRLRFPGHEHTKIIDGVPEGWERVTLRDVATLNYGKALKDENRIPGDVPVYGSSGIVGTHNLALLSGPGIILGRKGNVGSVRWSPSDFFPIDTVYFIAAEQSNFHLYMTLLHMQFMSTDVAVPGLNRDFAYSRMLVRPSFAVAGRFEEEVAPIFFQVQKLTELNIGLAKARDLLLPRLMSGSLAV